jgi:hypothetical protein
MDAAGADASTNVRAAKQLDLPGTRVTVREGVRPTGFSRLWFATLNSLRGLKLCYQSEAAFPPGGVGCARLIRAGLWLGDSMIERLLLVGSVLGID